jgi:hyperosmotically inducible protein
MTAASSAEVAGIGWQSRGRDMRHSRIFGALVLASVVMVTMPPYASCGIIDDKAERNPLQAEKEAQKPAREAKMSVSDSWLTARTKIELFADERIKFRQISVETVNGTVRLRGTVDSEEARAAAISVASRVDGVRRVRSDLQVVRLERKTVHAIDREITQWVKADLSRDTGLNTVHARTDHGVVTLTGQVTDIGAGSRASDIAGGVPGVRSVKNELTYRSPHGNTDRSVLGALILFMSGKAPPR